MWNDSYLDKDEYISHRDIEDLIRHYLSIL